MAIWKEPVPRKDEQPLVEQTLAAPRAAAPETHTPYAPPPARAEAPSRAAAAHDGGESLLTSGLTVEGTVRGVGHIRIAGQFRGDVQVDGNLAIESGARVVGAVVADTVSVAGELEGNIDNASKVELLASGVLTGDLKAGSLVVAAGSRMRGRVEFGWPEPVAPAPRSSLKIESDKSSKAS